MNDRKVLYAFVSLRYERSDRKVVAEHPKDPTYRSISLEAIESSLRSPEDEKLIIDRGKYTLHALTAELCYGCLTERTYPAATSLLESRSQALLERLRSVYRELPILADLPSDLPNLSAVDLSAPLQKIVNEYNHQNTEVIPKLENELAEIRHALMEGVRKLIDRGEKLDDLVRKTQSLEIMSRDNFHVISRSTRKKSDALVATGAAALMFISTSLLVFLLYIGML